MEILIMALANVLCFVIGARVGQQVSRGEAVALPSPMQAVRQHRARAEEKKEQDRLATILENIARYDGTPAGQQEV